MGVSALKVASLLVYGCFEDSLFLAVTPLSFGGVSAVFFWQQSAGYFAETVSRSSCRTVCLDLAGSRGCQIVAAPQMHERIKCRMLPADTKRIVTIYPKLQFRPLGDAMDTSVAASSTADLLALLLLIVCELQRRMVVGSAMPGEGDPPSDDSLRIAE